MSFWGKVFRDERLLEWVLVGALAVFYGLCLSDLGLVPRAMPMDLTFNSMLEHMLRGRFDVGPGVIGDEGFLSRGLVVSYWGIWCALLRLPLWAVGRLDVDVTTWSCWVAACVAGVAKVRTVLFLRGRYRRDRAKASETAEAAFALMLAYAGFGGSSIAFLKSSIFQEIVLWAAAFGAVFVYWTVRGVALRRFGTETLCWMAGSAGLGLLTRVSTGLGMCVAFGLVVVVLVVQRACEGEGGSFAGRLWRAAVERRVVVSVAVLAALLVVTGWVNYGRWGHVTTFADHTLYLTNRLYPDRMPRTRLYGYFNVRRIPFGLNYFFFPVWGLTGAAHRGLLEGMQTRLMDAVELPPSSLLLTDLMPICFAWFLGRAMWIGRAATVQPVGVWLAAAVGLAVPCGLMLTAISMNYRYRMEFYPEMQLLGFLGLYAVVCDEGMLARFGRVQGWLRAGLWVSLAAGLVSLVLYKLSPWGPSQRFLHEGLVSYYRHDAWR